MRPSCLLPVIYGRGSGPTRHPVPEFLALSVALFSCYFALNDAGFAFSSATCIPAVKERTCQGPGFNTPREQDLPFGETENGMHAELNQQIHQLRQMTTAQLQLKYPELFGQASHSNHKNYLF